MKTRKCIFCSLKNNFLNNLLQFQRTRLHLTLSKIIHKTLENKIDKLYKESLTKPKHISISLTLFTRSSPLIWISVVKSWRKLYTAVFFKLSYLHKIYSYFFYINWTLILVWLIQISDKLLYFSKHKFKTNKKFKTFFYIYLCYKNELTESEKFLIFFKHFKGKIVPSITLK